MGAGGDGRLPGPPRFTLVVGATATPHDFTPLVWEAYGRVAPATDRWLTEAFRAPALEAVRAGLLRDVSVAIWQSHARGVADSYARCLVWRHPQWWGVQLWRV